MRPEEGITGDVAPAKAGRRDITERTFAFAVSIVTLTRRLNRGSLAERSMVSQLLRSGTSVGANIEEAQAAQSRPDFISKNCIALKEAREARYWLRLLIATRTLDDEATGALLQEATELCNILGAIVARTRERS